MHAHPVTNRKLHLVSIVHRECGSLGVLGSALPGRSAAEDVCSARSAQCELRLEEPRLVLVGFRGLLVVHQEQRDDLLSRRRWPPDDAANEDRGLLGIRHQRRNLAQLESKRDLAPCGSALPDALGIPRIGHMDLALDPTVMAPGRLDFERLTARIDAECYA